MELPRTQLGDKVEHFLKRDDKISLLFLLVDNAESALKYADSLTPIQDWCNVQTMPNCSDKLQEALCIMGCNKMFGNMSSKQTAVERFLPDNPEASLFVNLLRKNLYLMCEKLSKDESTKLINLMEPDTNEPSPNLELHLLKWLNCGKIAPGNIEFLSKTLEKINRKDLSISITNAAAEKNKPTAESSFQKEKKFNYRTDSGKGFCIIINQKKFYNEPDISLPLRVPLETRIGTDVDRDRLLEIFKMFNMDVVLWENYTKEELKSELARICKDLKENHSMLIICVLSHGEGDKVYCANNTVISIGDLKRYFFAQSCPVLIGKPKLFIIQACKGNNAQIAVNQRPNPAPVPAHKKTVSSDSPSTSDTLVANEADFLTFHSTVSGCVSFRDLLDGTWFIDAFCNALLFETQKKGMLEVFTDINRIASDKKIVIANKMCAIMPMFDTTLRGDFKLNFNPGGVINATIDCMERILFSCLLEEYLENYSPEK